MVDYAAHFHRKLVSNSLTGLPLPTTQVAQNIGLLGHSIGAGLMTYVAETAAKKQPYKAVMYLAPQTEVSGWLLGSLYRPLCRAPALRQHTVY